MVLYPVNSGADFSKMGGFIYIVVFSALGDLFNYRKIPMSHCVRAVRESF